MIKYNYNEACIATGEELDPLYDAEEGCFIISDNPEINNRFLKIPKLIEKGIRPFITLKNSSDDTTFYSVHYALQASVNVSEGVEYINAEFSGNSTYNWWYEDGKLAIAE